MRRITGGWGERRRGWSRGVGADDRGLGWSRGVRTTVGRTTGVAGRTVGNVREDDKQRAGGRSETWGWMTGGWDGARRGEANGGGADTVIVKGSEEL